MKGHYLKMSLFLGILLFNACSNVEKVEHIEVFVAETLEQNNEGKFDATGYKKVNSLTILIDIL
ncbi:hypothetical protein [Paenibacillus silviterrae]|uniref:hypothetical protein n=1 Tax=Paenibacillus silviterrae TaxID=3242194 RepID=UPI002543DAE5|nr:hypothetical protein [Paenibacillus chinjuensis]